MTEPEAAPRTDLTDRTPARFLSEMEDIERRYTLAVHDLYCDEEPKGHEAADHEPFDGIDDPDELVPWVDVVGALARRGLILSLIDEAEPVVPELTAERLRTLASRTWSDVYRELRAAGVSEDYSMARADVVRNELEKRLAARRGGPNDPA